MEVVSMQQLLQKQESNMCLHAGLEGSHKEAEV